MTKKELIQALMKLSPESDDNVVIIGDRNIGWSNIETVAEHRGLIHIMPEQFPVFSDN
jgi:hypothetical protein